MASCEDAKTEVESWKRCFNVPSHRQDDVLRLLGHKEDEDDQEGSKHEQQASQEHSQRHGGAQYRGARGAVLCGTDVRGGLSVISRF